MSDYKRTTKLLGFHQLPTECVDAIIEHYEYYNLGRLFDEQSLCVETVSERKKKKKIMGIKVPALVKSYVLLSPTWLGYITSADGSKFSAMTVPLVEAIVEDYAKSPFFKKIPDNGFWVHGKFTGVVGGAMSFSDRSSIFIGLGQERAAEEFSQALLDAIEKTRRA